MPRFPYLSAIFLLLSLVIGAVMVPNTVQILPPVSQIEAELSSRFGGTVKIEGAVRLRFVPRLQVIIDKVSFRANTEADARFAATMPRLIVDLSLAEMLQGRVSSRAFILLNPDVQIRLNVRPVAMLTRLHNIILPPVTLLNGDFRITGLDPLQPSGQTNIDGLSVILAAQQGDGRMRISLRKSLSGGQAARLGLNVVRRAREIEIGLTIGLGINEQLQFSGFLSDMDAQWRLDGEVELVSDNLLASAIEARLPLTVLPDGRRLSLSGLVRGSPSGLRSDSLEIEALNTVFVARMSLNWPRLTGEVPMLDGRISTGSVDLDLLRPNFGNRPDALLTGLWRNLAPDLSVSLALEATRFIVGNETGSDLSAAFIQKSQDLSLQRLNLNLPFRSSLLASGRFDLAAQRPHFDGNFSARSSDTLALLLWLGNRYGVDFSAFAETVDEANLQRTSLVGDVKFNDDGLVLNGLAGRLGDDYFSAQITLPDLSAQRANVLFNINRLDLADWGIVVSGSAARDGGVAGVGRQINRLLSALMREADDAREIDFDIKVGRAFVDTRRLGPAHVRGAIRNQAMRLDRMHMSNLSNADIQLTGSLNYETIPTHGALSLSIESASSDWLDAPISARFAPLYFNSDAASRLAVDIILTAPNSEAWPKVLYSAGGDIGEMALDFAMSTPARSLAFVESGTEISLGLDGAANNLAPLFFLPATYDDAARGRMQVTLNASGNDLFAITGDMALADDNLALNGSLRAGTGGRSLSGALEFNLAKVLAILDPSGAEKSVAAGGKVQLTATPDNVSFSGLDMSFSQGHISGEGVLQLRETLPQLNINIAADNVDMSWLLPQRKAQNWRDEGLTWSVLGRGDANIELRAGNMRFGQLTLDTLAGRLKLTEGVLEAPEMTATMLGGTMTANLLAEGGLLTPRFAFDGQFNDVNPSMLVAARYGDALVDAGLSGAFRLEGRGSSTRAVMGSLGGEVNFEIAPGELTFFDAVGFAEAVRANDFSGNATELVAQYTGAHRLSFARGLGRANMRNGVIETASSDFVFADGLNEARLEGALDMVGLEVDAAFALYPFDRQKPVLWQITGNLEKPDLKADASAFNPIAAAPNATPPPAE
ncbi:MAG: hypothetical protein CML95_08390 [Rhodobiaceae bacterium]|nr:hypothetical protein [Rhodobiaceae bacterium]